ncbi:MAG: hypothetical protein GYA15_05850 [Leptolinea sp.]|jgi:hypothetical protein|nr:hypothetical protein [Leptolinea sp.]
MHKSKLWITFLVFILTLGVGYWLGENLVIKHSTISSLSVSPIDTSSARVITLLEVNDLTQDKPELLSIWNIHLTPGDSPRLGFTPVAAISLPDDPNHALLDQFNLDENRSLSMNFMRSLSKNKVKSDGYIILDQTAIIAFVNWLSGKDTQEPIGLQNHSMSEYGLVLRSMCQSLTGFSESAHSEFPWSKFASTHFLTSLSFENVMANLSFITSTSAPHCEMVPFP